ncbi:holo-[acyl-carrier-protein] synthase [Candidatus Izimaplasma bacterium ZiA1]|uniref:holo-ACP synthase n=1 Tax=Candidatus Izimoplasma sp. ZiA1 TaxID=2024899 RepID=UPI000BAA4EC6|nr:holo-[acyl-carrier-protein] synthase [Candidatus Izimaplasma bacterium ZiA1]
MDSIGVDIVEFSRIKEMMNDKFIKRILSVKELELFNSFKSEKRKVEYLAGRFAAKEAYTKVYKKFNEKLNFTDVEVLKDEFGAPYIISKYHPEDEILVSISHSENYAVAMCIKK